MNPQITAGLLAFCLLVFSPYTSGSSAELRTAILQDIPTTSPFSFHGPTSRRILNLAYQGLTAWGPNGIEPALAESWHSRDGGKTWRFALVPEVHFHTGRPFTSEDVIQTVRKFLSPIGTLAVERRFFSGLSGAAPDADRPGGPVAGVGAIGRQGVEFRFDRPNPRFPAMSFPVVAGDARTLEAAGVPSAGTGPFVITAWRKGVEVVLERHPPAASAVDRVRVQVIPNSDAMLTAFDAGNLDFVIVPEDQIRTVHLIDRYKRQARTFTRPQFRYLGMNQRRYHPFRDIRVREAVIAAIDRAAIANVFYGFAAQVTGGAIPEGLGYTGSAVVQVPYDPARARRLLAAAGFGPDRAMPALTLVVDAANQDIASVVAAGLRAVGLPVGVQLMERGAMVAAQNRGALAFFLSGWTAQFPDCVEFLDPVWSSHSRFNRSRWHNPAFDLTVARAKTAATREERQEECRQAEAILVREKVFVPMPTPKYVILLQPGVEGISLSPSGGLNLTHARVP